MDILKGFVVLEGLDGAGTSTQLRLIDQWLTDTNRPHVMQAEPTDGPVGKLIREILRGVHHVEPMTLAMLYAADRREHVRFIRQRLSEGKLVICDRYIPSSLAYQGVNCPLDTVKAWNQDYPQPGLYLYVDTPVDECIRRIKHRAEPVELFEHREFLTNVQAGYEAAFKAMPEGVSVKRIDGCLSPEAIATEIKQILGSSRKVGD